MTDLQRSLLKDVSRSFNLSFVVLPKEVRPVMSLGYLLCRAADTIADTPTTPLDEKLRLLKKFKALFGTFPLSEELLKDFLRDLEEADLTPKTNEKKLLAHLNLCAAWFAALGKADQSMLQSVVSAVITGMEMDMQVFGEPEEGKAKSLSTDKDLETYIHWIGGEPGRFWSNICISHLPRLGIENRDRWMQDGIVFGTGLQMVNILRDLPADLKMGRCYIPLELLERHGLTLENALRGEKMDVFLTLYNDLIDQTMFRLNRGLSYMAQLPKWALGLRAAVWLPMMIGVKTLVKLRDNPTILKSTAPVKVKRKEIYRLIAASVWRLPFNSLLKRFFDREV